jgi:uncharacterized protein (DUF488 family)
VNSTISEFIRNHAFVRSVQHRPFQSSADHFQALLQTGGVNAVADVRSVPSSRFFPWFSQRNLEARLSREGIAYLSYGDALGGRPGDASLYRDGIADYDAMAAHPDFERASTA